MITKKWNGTTLQWENDYPTVSIDKIIATGTPSSTTFLRGDGQWIEVTGGSSFDQSLNTTDDVEFNSVTTDTVILGGQDIVWDSAAGSIAVTLNSEVTWNGGLEVLFYGKVKTGETITNGMAIMFAGIEGDHVLLEPADPDTLASHPTYYMGMATQGGSGGDFIYVTSFGYVHGLDTGGLGWTAGSILYVNTNSGATAGTYTATKPDASRGIIEGAAVIAEETGDANNGVALVRKTLISRVIGDIAGLQDALDTKATVSALNSHTSDTDNPHSVTLAQLGFTGDTNANYITNNNELTNGAGYITSYINNYITGLSGNGDSTLTVTRQDLTNLTVDLSHTHSEYLTSFTETDPIFTAWDKSTGISITESQISDFGSYEPANSNIQTHISSTSNPHGVTASQVGAYTTSQVDSAISTAVSNLVNGADAAYDTLKEIQDAMATDAELAAAIGALVIGNGTQTITAGSGISGGGSFTANQTGNSSVTISHADTSTQSSSSNSGRTYIQNVTLDTYGHVTGLTTATETVVNTDTNTWRPITAGGNTLSSSESLTLVAGTNVSISENAGTVTINSSYTDTNTWRPIDDIPVDGATTESISSNWAFDHSSGTTNLHSTIAEDVALGTSTQYWLLSNDSTNFYIKSGTGTGTTRFYVNTSGTAYATTFSGNGSALTSLNASNLTTGTVGTARLGSGTADSSTYLRGDGTWGTPSYTVNTDTNYYLTGVSGSGDGTVTFTRSGLTNLTWDASHSHSEYSLTTHTHSYLPLSGGTLTGTLTSVAIAMQNNNLTGVGSLQFNDPGVNEGISWNGGNISIFESPDNLSNAAGNLQIVNGSTRLFTISSAGDAELVDGILKLNKTDDDVSDQLQFYVGGTRIGEIGGEDTTWLRINQETSKNIYTPRYIRADGGFFVDGSTYGVDGSGNGVFNTSATIGGNDVATQTWVTSQGYITGYTDTNTTYSHKASSQTGGAGLDLDAGGSGSGTDTVVFKGSGATTVTYTDANTITISSTDTDTDTWRAIHDTPVDGATTTSISSNWAFDHSSGTTNLHSTIAEDVALGTSTQYWLLSNDSTNFYIKSGTGTGTTRFYVNTSGTAYATTFSGNGSALTSLNASNLTTGTVGTARLGSGTADSSTYLRGDGTWATVSGGWDPSTLTQIPIGLNAVASGSSATSIGYNSDATGAYSVALGYYSQALNSYAVALGYSADADGTYSTAVGGHAEANGSYTSAFGYDAYVSSIYTNSTMLGEDATASASYQVRLGDASITSLVCADTTISTTSDINDKTDFGLAENALEFIMDLNPVTYVRNPRDNYKLDKEDYTEEQMELYRVWGQKAYDKEAHAAAAKKGSRRQVGFIAQEVAETMLDIFGSDNYAGVVNISHYDDGAPEEVERRYSVEYSRIIPFLVGAIQEQQEEITSLKTELESIKDDIQTLKDLMGVE